MEKYKVGDMIIIKTANKQVTAESNIYTVIIRHVKDEGEQNEYDDDVDCEFSYFDEDVKYLIKLSRNDHMYGNDLYPLYESEIIGMATELAKALYGKI